MMQDINSTHTQQLQREAALQGMVLLRNDHELLPLKPGSNIAVVGPMGDIHDLMSDYAGSGGEGGCWPEGDASCIVTIFEAIRSANKGGTTHSAAGIPPPHDPSPPAKLLAAAVAVAKAADTVVLVLGNSRAHGRDSGVGTVEHEGVDRPDVNLTAAQHNLAMQVLALGKPTLLVMSNGGAISIDSLIADPSVHAIVEAFNPAHNTPELAQLLFGEANSWGKLPVTIYSHNYTTGGGGLPAQPMDNYDMVASPGRTYRWYRGEPLFAFGSGLSLTSFAHSCSCATEAVATADDIECNCTAKNTGKLAGDEVVMVYDALSPAIRSSIGSAHPVPRKRLVDFERVSVAAGGTATVRFIIPKAALVLTTADGSTKLYSGEHELIFSRGNGADATVAVTV